MLYHPLFLFVAAVHLAFLLSDYTKLHTRRVKHLPVFLFAGSVAWETLTGQVTEPGVLTAISQVIPWNHQKNRFRVQSSGGATTYLQAGVLLSYQG